MRKVGYTIFEKISKWWQDEGKVLASEHGGDMTHDHLIERHERIISVIRLVLLPLCSYPYDLAIKIRTLINEFDAANLPVLSTLPALVRIFPELHGDAVERIRRGLFSRDEQHSHEAIGALYIWASEANVRSKNQVPSDLLFDFSTIVSNRQSQSLMFALMYGRRLLVTLPADRRGLLLPNFILGLDYLHDETRYRTAEDLPGSPFPSEMIPEFRVRAAQLAVAIQATSSGEHPVITRWLDAIQIDPVLEVRRARDAAPDEDD